MRYEHGPGGLVGITLKPNTMKKWALKFHILSCLVKDLDVMRENYCLQMISCNCSADRMRLTRCKCALKVKCLNPCTKTKTLNR